MGFTFFSKIQKKYEKIQKTRIGKRFKFGIFG